MSHAHLNMQDSNVFMMLKAQFHFIAGTREQIETEG